MPISMSEAMDQMSTSLRQAGVQMTDSKSERCLLNPARDDGGASLIENSNHGLLSSIPSTNGSLGTPNLQRILVRLALTSLCNGNVL